MCNRRHILLPLLLLLVQHTSATVPAKDPVAKAAMHLRCEILDDRANELRIGDPVRSLSIAKEALAVAEMAADTDLELRVLGTIAATQLHMGVYEEYLRTRMRSLKLVSATGDHKEIAFALQDLSDAYSLNRQLEQAVAEAKRALAMLISLYDDEAIAKAQYFYLNSLLNAGRFGDVISGSTAALEACKKVDDEMAEARVYQVMARAFIGMNKPADAAPFLAKADRVLIEKGSDLDRFHLSIDRSKAMLALGFTAQSRTALDEAGLMTGVLIHPQHKLTLLQQEYELCLALHEWKSALGLLQQIKWQSDSLELARLEMKLAGSQVINDVRANDEDNDRLKVMNAKQAETIAYHRTNTYYLLALLAASLILAVALFTTSRYAKRMMRRLARKNELIRKQNEEIQAKVLELKRQNLRLAESLMSEEEKELILKEIHHRVKNNLQVVDSLLNIQGNDVDDPRLHRLLKDAQGRIRSMAMVHEHIYRSSGSMHASLRTHLEKLGRSVLVAHGAHDRVSISVDTALPSFPEETLLPLSLVINELLTNSLKHAFAGKDGGNIKIRVQAKGTGYELRYSDDGVGIGQVDGISGNRSFGHELITILAHQLNGEVHMVHSDGVSLCMTFTPDKELLKAAV